MTYRAIGSSTGMLEFVGPSYGFKAQADFGVGDIPMSAPRFAELTANGREMLHVPVAIGAIALFHSVPESELGGEPIDLDACLIARIYAGDITRWDHPDIKAKNPKMTTSSPIYVAHRVEGSSSTSGFTTYLSRVCPSQSGWTNGGAASFTNWPIGVGREGSGGMTDYLVTRPYAIAYIDSGHGIDNKLAEIALKNFDGVFLKSSEANIGEAATRGVNSGVFPAEPDASFADVELFDLPGPTTWPITMVTYIYLEKDWTAKSPQTAALLYAFVQFIISAEGQLLAEENQFVEMPPALVALANKALSMVTLPEGTTLFTRETSTQGQAGQQAYVISDKRQSFADYERKELLKDLAQTKATQALLLDTLAQEQKQFAEIQAELMAEHEAFERAVLYVDQQGNNTAVCAITRAGRACPEPA
jgi:phosphate transport system substrate-binding protein